MRRERPPSGRRPAGRALTERDVVVWCNAGAGGGTDPDAIVAALRAAGRRVRCPDWGGDWNEENDPPDPASDLVLVAGGDGTVARAARRLEGSGVPLAIWPRGTANNIAASLGITAIDPAAALAGRLRAIDMGVAHGPWGRQAFVESLGAGALAAAERAAHERAADGGYGPGGKLAAGRREIVRTIAGVSLADRVEVLDPEASAPSPLAFVEVANLARTGPAVLLAPDADPGDGLLDVVMGDHRAVGALGAACEGAEGTDAVRPDPLPTIRRRARVELACRASALRIDGTFAGEIGAGTSTGTVRVTIDVHAGALRVVVPME